MGGEKRGAQLTDKAAGYKCEGSSGGYESIVLPTCHPVIVCLCQEVVKVVVVGVEAG